MLVRDNPNGPVRFVQQLACSQIVGIGAEFSYSIYLIHQFCFAVTAWLIGQYLVHNVMASQAIFIAGATICTISFSAIMFFSVERPMRAWGKHMSRYFWSPKKKDSPAS